jgi:hypothetical protein
MEGGELRNLPTSGIAQVHLTGSHQTKLALVLSLTGHSCPLPSGQNCSDNQPRVQKWGERDGFNADLNKQLNQQFCCCLMMYPGVLSDSLKQWQVLSITAI